MELILKSFFERYSRYGIFALRIVIGFRLLYGNLGYVFGYQPMEEIILYFEKLGIPDPYITSYLSIYGEAIAGLMILVGFRVRLAALVLLINFTVAVIYAHAHDSIMRSFGAWVILAFAVCILFHGAGKPSVDEFKR